MATPHASNPISPHFEPQTPAPPPCHRHVCDVGSPGAVMQSCPPGHAVPHAKTLPLHGSVYRPHSTPAGQAVTGTQLAGAPSPVVLPAPSFVFDPVPAPSPPASSDVSPPDDEPLPEVVTSALAPVSPMWPAEPSAAPSAESWLPHPPVARNGAAVIALSTARIDTLGRVINLR
jgi:hypothetical protein